MCQFKAVEEGFPVVQGIPTFKLMPLGIDVMRPIQKENKVQYELQAVISINCKSRILTLCLNISRPATESSTGNVVGTSQYYLQVYNRFQVSTMLAKSLAFLCPQDSQLTSTIANSRFRHLICDSTTLVTLLARSTLVDRHI